MKYLIFVLFLAGCATTAKGPSYSEAKAPGAKPGYATLYVIREYAEPTAWGANVQVNGEPVTDLNQKGFTWTYIKPGKAEIKAIWPKMSSQKDSFITIDAVAGKTYYVELTGVSRMTDFTLTTFYFKVGSGLNEMKPEEATKKLATCCQFQAPKTQ